MHQRLKERLVGAAVLVVIAVIFIPMLLTGPMDSGAITKTNIPDRPTEKFSSKLISVTDSIKAIVETDESGFIEDSVLGDNQQITDVEEKTTDKPKANDPVKTESKAETKITDKKPQQKKVIKAKQVGLTAWVVQLGYFSSKLNADKLNLNLRKAGFPAFVEPQIKKGETSYRVRVGPEILRADADALLKKIKTKMKLDGIVLSYP
jgi:DedD protein